MVAHQISTMSSSAAKKLLVVPHIKNMISCRLALELQEVHRHSETYFLWGNISMSPLTGTHN
jgi:hypothetical protein